MPTNIKRILLSLIFTAVLIPQSKAQNYKLHSVFLYSFARSIQWPESSSTGDFQITVLGKSPILEELKAMAETKKIGERTIKVNSATNASQIESCNIVFVSAESSKQLDGLLAQIGNKPIIVITEGKGLAEKGSAINFILKDGKLAFEINRKIIEKQNFKVSGDLMRLAILI
jgi:hypothetical protein